VVDAQRREAREKITRLKSLRTGTTASETENAGDGSSERAAHRREGV